MDGRFERLCAEVEGSVLHPPTTLSRPVQAVSDQSAHFLRQYDNAIGHGDLMLCNPIPQRIALPSVRHDLVRHLQEPQVASPEQRKSDHVPNGALAAKRHIDSIFAQGAPESPHGPWQCGNACQRRYPAAPILFMTDIGSDWLDRQIR